MYSTPLSSICRRTSRFAASRPFWPTKRSRLVRATIHPFGELSSADGEHRPLSTVRNCGGSLGNYARFTYGKGDVRPWTHNGEHPVDQDPALHVAHPEFSITSAGVGDARERSWYADTNYGIAVLCYDEASRCPPSPAQTGSNAWPAHHGVTGGPFARWLSSWMLNLEGDDHYRIRRLMNPGFSPRYIQTFTLRFRPWRTNWSTPSTSPAAVGSWVNSPDHMPPG